MTNANLIPLHVFFGSMMQQNNSEISPIIHFFSLELRINNVTATTSFIQDNV